MDHFQDGGQLQVEIPPLSEFPSRAKEKFGDKVFLRKWDGEKHAETTFTEFSDNVDRVAKWLLDYGIQNGNRVAVLGENSPEWATTYMAVHRAGGVIVPIDRLLSASNIKYILEHSESRIIFVSGRFIDLVVEALPVKTLERIVCFAESEEPNVISWDSVVNFKGGDHKEFPKRSLNEMAAILYTSGTTGSSKGVMLTHENLASNAITGGTPVPIDTNDIFLSLMPLHHALECTCSFLAPIYLGASITYARSLKSTEMIADVRETGVTVITGVPLLFEKMHNSILRNVRKNKKPVRALFSFILGMSKFGEKIGIPVGRVLFRGIRKKAGLGTMRIFLCGGAPLSKVTSRFFNSFGIMMLQGYGLTETSPLAHYSPPKRIVHGRLGLPFPGVQARIDEPDENDVGEICLRGQNVFIGYYKNDEATEEAFDNDGWFYTGDLGKIHSDGYLEITGRKKNLIVTGGGKNVYPEEIEHFVNQIPYVGESVVLGVPRPKGSGEIVGALIQLDEEGLPAYEEEHGIKLEGDLLVETLRKDLKEAQKELADYKHIRRFKILDEEFEKTSTRKIKRFKYKGSILEEDYHKS